MSSLSFPPTVLATEVWLSGSFPSTHTLLVCTWEHEGIIGHRVDYGLSSVSVHLQERISCISIKRLPQLS